MANYKTSLLNPSSGLFDAVLSNDHLSIAFNDYSNYTTNSESGHAAANFTMYRRIVVEHQSGNKYIYSSIIGSGNKDILPGNSGVNVFTFVITNGDGIYTFSLASVPTWDASITYTANVHCVYRDGLLYIALTTGSNMKPEDNPNDWKVIAFDDLPGKYLDVQYFMVTCDSDSCLQKIVPCAACEISKNNCNPEILCKSPVVLNAMKMQILIMSAHLSFADGDFTCAARDIDTMKSICLCIDCDKPVSAGGCGCD